MQRNHMPNAAKIRYLEGDLKTRKECLPRIASHDTDVAKAMQYQIEILEAILADYKENERLIAAAEDRQEGRR